LPDIFKAFNVLFFKSPVPIALITRPKILIFNKFKLIKVVFETKRLSNECNKSKSSSVKINSEDAFK